VLELTAQTRQIEEYTFQGFEAFSAATFIYITVRFIVMAAMTVVERKMSIPGMISLGAK
jgi:glutamate/aspartate transport system permease protein